MRTKSILLSIALTLPILLPAQNKGRAGVTNVVQQLKQDTLFRDAVTGLMVMDPNGVEVASWNPDMPLLTASTMKTITTGVALVALGPDYRYTTQIAYSGEISNGSLDGNLYIIGGGDPTLGSKDSIATPINEVFAFWTHAIKELDIQEIKGSIVADDRFFTHEVIPESWSWGNLNSTSGIGPSGLSFYENRLEATLVPGLFEGDKVIIRNEYPFFPDMQFDNRLTTGPTRTRSRTSIRNSDLSPLIRITGSIPVGADSVNIAGSNKFSPLSCAWQFNRFLNQNGVATTQNIRMIDSENDPQTETLTHITSSTSPRLADIIWVTNHISNNFFAETILKTIGKERTGVGSYDSAYVAVTRVLKELGISTRGMTMADGSGLSRQNYVSARFFCNYYAALKKSPIYPQFFDSFPVPGGFGTLKTVIVRAPKKDRLHAKSGTLSNVRCYAGYVDTPSGIYTFAIMVNNYSATAAQIQVGVERFLQSLTEL
ncbi:MAG: D-alanyl-D-alanine carboxypeptidase/D-alanyl-D-alanine-endopeptidase [Prevotellaceae bacterium]|nr:D-alanyl-D-alanine carboxypeptidase/D-alanyl-D-alanine-endopeptidase [Prevotellaceae bacterium]